MNVSFIRNVTIRYKLLCAFSLLAVFLGLFVFIFFPYQQRRQILEQARENSLSIAYMTADNLAVGLEFEDRAIIQEVLQILQQKRDFEYVVVLDKTGGIFEIINSGKITDPTNLDNAEIPICTIADDTAITKIPITYQNSTVGMLLLGLSIKNSIAAIERTTMIALVVSIVLVLIMIALSFLIGNIITRPIHRVIAASSKIADGDFSNRLAVHTHDEVGQLADAFNKMSTKLEIGISELERSEERYRLHFENVSDVIVSYTTDMQVLDVSPSVERFLGYTADELIGRRFQDLNIFAEQSMHEAQEKLNKLLQGDEIFPAEYEFITKDGVRKYGEVSTTPLREGGNVTKLLSIVRDTTDRKDIEERLLQSQKLEAIGTLSGGIAHDFNNILAIILGHTELAMDLISKKHTAYAKLEQILRASLKARDLIRQILSFSRKTASKKKALHLGALTKETLTLLRSTIPATIEIKQETDCASDIIMADATQIHQMILNLCTNAEQEMHETGGILTVSLTNVDLTEDDILQYQDLKPGTHTKLTVKDTGRGIDADIMNRIFEPFFTTKQKGNVKGTGLGLATVHGIIKQHKGDIHVESRPGAGASFQVYLPVVKAHKPEDTPLPSTPHPTGSERILVVDDEQQLAEMVQQVLEHLGYTVEIALDGEEALELFRRQAHAFDLVITDQTMPYMTGDVLIQKLRTVRNDIPVILCTGHSDLITEKKIQEQGINRFVMKPYKIHTIAKIIREILDVR